MSDHERIWLQNAEDARTTGDRLWCQDKVWPECAEQQEPTEYIRADLYASRISQQDAELERAKAEARKAAFIEAGQKALEWAAHYSPASDGRNTFVLFSEWAEAKAEETRT